MASDPSLRGDEGGRRREHAQLTERASRVGRRPRPDAHRPPRPRTRTRAARGRRRARRRSRARRRDQPRRRDPGRARRARARCSRACPSTRCRGRAGAERAAGARRTSSTTPPSTLSNLGALGVDHFTGVIALGQTSLLTVGRAVRRPVVGTDGTLHGTDDVPRNAERRSPGDRRSGRSTPPRRLHRRGRGDDAGLCEGDMNDHARHAGRARRS